MNPAKVVRSKLHLLTDLPNIGPSLAGDLEFIGIKNPEQLCGQNPYRLYEQLCAKSGVHHDPCVLDTFISITRFMDGEDPKPWWHYTAERKLTLSLRE